MSIDFPSPSYRAAGGDLAVQISPLGMIELSDEEFEVHGPRMVRYSNAAAFYLGHHWSYKAPPGEEQLTFNYVRQLSDFLTNFCFTKGVNFSCDWAYQHIVPALLDRVWTVDNDKEQFLWEMGNMGSIYGDVFIKVAHEDAYMESTGVLRPAKVRVLLLNPAHCFPQWHPHDRSRMEQFKLKYKFFRTEPDGTRLLHTYVEIITDSEIREYVDDRLCEGSPRPNPLGRMPIVHIANAPAAGSPWGLSDVWELIPANRNYNEKAVEVSQIINYHSAPVTIISGGKPPNLEKGPNKIWGVPNDKAKVYNLEGGASGIEPALEFMEMELAYMHKAAGVTTNALGDEQAISNTSGVALSIQYMPTMLKFRLKMIMYGRGLREVNELILLTLFQSEPDTLWYDPNTDGIMQPGQSEVLDPSDYRVYVTATEWMPPLPVDILVKLEEIQQKLALGLESKKGALQDLGEEFPDEKLSELFDEQRTDTVLEGAKELIRAHMNAITLALTGQQPESTEAAPPPQTGPEGQPVNQPAPPAAQNLPNLPGMNPLVSQMVDQEKGQLMDRLVVAAYGPKQQAFKNPDDTNSSSKPG